MSSPRQMVLATIRDLKSQVLQKQAALVMEGSTRRRLQAAALSALDKEMETFKEVRALKDRIGYELTKHADLLGVIVVTPEQLERLLQDDDDEGDNEGEEWKGSGSAPA